MSSPTHYYAVEPPEPLDYDEAPEMPKCPYCGCACTEDGLCPACGVRVERGVL